MKRNQKPFDQSSAVPASQVGHAAALAGPYHCGSETGVSAGLITRRAGSTPGAATIKITVEAVEVPYDPQTHFTIMRLIALARRLP